FRVQFQPAEPVRDGDRSPRCRIRSRVQDGEGRGPGAAYGHPAVRWCDDGVRCRCRRSRGRVKRCFVRSGGKPEATDAMPFTTRACVHGTSALYLVMTTEITRIIWWQHPM